MTPREQDASPSCPSAAARLRATRAAFAAIAVPCCGTEGGVELREGPGGSLVCASCDKLVMIRAGGEP